MVIEPPSHGNVIRFPLKKAHFFTLPLPLPTSLRNSWAWANIAGKVVLTHYVMEQLPGHIDSVVEKLLIMRPQEVLHIEPMAELLHPLRSLTDLETWLHTYLSHYQTSLLRVLQAHEAGGRLVIKDIIPLGFAAQLRSSPTLIRWIPL